MQILDNRSSYFIIPIAVLYSMFFTKLVNILLGYEEIKALCDGKSWGYQDDNKECYTKKRQLMDMFESKKFNVMLVVGLMGILFGAFMLSQDVANGQLGTAGAGVALGGVLTIFYFILVNWGKLNEVNKTIITGGVLAGLIGGSYYILSPNFVAPVTTYQVPQKLTM